VLQETRRAADFLLLAFRAPSPSPSSQETERQRNLSLPMPRHNELLMLSVADFCRVEASAPAHRCTAAPQVSVWKRPKANFWGLVGFVPTYYTMSHPYSFSPLHCPVILSVSHYTIDPCTSPPNGRVTFAWFFYPVSLLFSLMDDASHLLTDIVTLPGASSTIKCK